MLEFVGNLDRFYSLSHIADNRSATFDLRTQLLSRGAFLLPVLLCLVSVEEDHS